MEMIKIGSDGLKIIMSRTDMEKYDIHDSSFDCKSLESQQALRAIINDAKRATGFDTSQRRLNVRFYSSKSGGCEIFVSKNDGFFGGTEISTSAEECKVKSAFMFNSLYDTINACRAIKNMAICGNTSVYSLDSDSFFICFYNSQPSDSVTSVLLEFGKSQIPEDISAILPEYGKIICEKDAVKLLSEL